MKMPKLFWIFQLLFHPIDSFDTLYPKPPSDEFVAAQRMKSWPILGLTLKRSDYYKKALAFKF